MLFTKFEKNIRHNNFRMDLSQDIMERRIRAREKSIASKKKKTKRASEEKKTKEIPLVGAEERK